jgi:hypothetical protein
MADTLLFDALLLLAFLCIGGMASGWWSPGPRAPIPAHPQPDKPTTKRTPPPKPFAGLTHKPHCAACEPGAEDPADTLPAAPPPLRTSPRGRPRQGDTADHFCPAPRCRYDGWMGRGNIRAKGHPSGGPWRQLHGTGGHGYVQETQDTPWHGKRVAPEKRVWAVGALAEGLGLRAVARVFEVDLNTVLPWLVEVAEHAAAFSRYFLHDGRVTQVQRDELVALLSAVKAGEVSEAAAITRFSRSPHWGWAAIDPVTTLLLPIDVGDRPVAMAQRVVHQVVQVLAPGCVPLCLTAGFTEYTTALLTHYGQWVQPARQRAQGPGPQPRWMPRPGLL